MTSNYLILYNYIHDRCISHVVSELAITIFCFDFGEIELRLMKMWPRKGEINQNTNIVLLLLSLYLEQMNIMIYDQ